MVGDGEAWLGLTDSDDIAGAVHDGAPVAALPLTPEMLLIPNAVAVTERSPHPQAAVDLMAFLQRREVVDRLVREGALEGATAPTDTGLQVDWEALLNDLEPATASLKQIFLR